MEGRAARKQAYEAAHPGKYYGVGFACIKRASVPVRNAASPGRDGARRRITLCHTGIEIGTGASSVQAVACARWLGRPADVLDGRHRLARAAGRTSGDPYLMSQADQDRLAVNPRWSPAIASASSASNSSYYFTHTTQEAARVVFLHGLWPAALAIWGRNAEA